MRITRIAEHLSAENLKEMMLGSESKEQFQRWQTIYVIKEKGLSPESAAEIVGMSVGTVHQWVHRYNQGGPDNYVLKGRGGRRSSYMSLEQEAALLEELSEDAGKDLLITAGDVQRRIKEKIGRAVWYELLKSFTRSE